MTPDEYRAHVKRVAAAAPSLPAAGVELLRRLGIPVRPQVVVDEEE